jgi:beta-mannosidase
MSTLATNWLVRHAPLTANAAPTAGEAWPCDLPMDVRTCLARQGVVPDPRFSMQSGASDWVATRSWWFSRDLPATPAAGRRFLKLHGLDFAATVQLDGVTVATVATHSRTAFVAVPDRGGALAIGLKPLPPDELDVSGPLPRWKGKLAHPKAAIFAGGDHNPFLINAGISHPPELLSVTGALLRHVRLEWDWSADEVVAGSIVVDAECWQATALTITLSPDAGGAALQTLSLTLQPGTGEQRAAFTGWKVRRWWPHNLGQPVCYRLAVASADQRIEHVVGFRTVERRRCDAFLATTPPSVMAWHPYENNGPYGIEYYKGYDAIREAGEAWPDQPREGSWNLDLHVNGQRVWISGGAVTPPTLFWSDWDGERQAALANRAVESGHNTLRIWGGGLLLDEAFYAACDRLGLMVHHDYLNFNGMVPRGWSALRWQEDELRAQARRLANHPCIIIMNGGNELFQNPGNRPTEPRNQAMARITRQELPQTLFHHSCPVNPEVHGPWLYNLDHAGRYASQQTPLNSECGVMGVPSLATLARTLTPAEFSAPFSPAWVHRICDPGYTRTLIANAALFAPPTTTSTAAVVQRTQYIQALGYQVIVEEFRRQRPASCGVITWEFSEPWNDLNWGLISNDLVPKASFHAFRRALTPRHASLRLLTPVVAAGATISAEVFAHDDLGRNEAVELTVVALTADGRELGRSVLRGPTTGPSTRLGVFTCTAPQAGACVLAVRGGAGVASEQWVNVLPGSRRSDRPKVLVVTGGGYEDHVTLQFLAAAGLDVTAVVADPLRPLTAPDPAGFAAVVIGPVYDPLASLTPAWLTALRAAVTAGRTGLLYVGYNTSAYVCGRYDVGDPSGSALEALLPATFTADCYGNSADPLPDPPLMRASGHPVWHGVDLQEAPGLGRRVGLAARPGTTVPAVAGLEPVIILGQLGTGRSAATTLPWGGHHYQGMGFRGWLPGQRLLANLVEWTATGTVAERPTVIHPYAPLTALPAARIATVVTATGPAAWRIVVTNSGTVPAFQVLAESGHPDEGACFDWHADDGSFTLLPGESRTIVCSATAIPGYQTPDGLTPEITAWNLES